MRKTNLLLVAGAVASLGACTRVPPPNWAESAHVRQALSAPPSPAICNKVQGMLGTYGRSSSDPRTQRQIDWALARERECQNGRRD